MSYLRGKGYVEWVDIELFAGIKEDPQVEFVYPRGRRNNDPKNAIPIGEWRRAIAERDSQG